MPPTNPDRVPHFGWILPEVENSGELHNTPKTTSQTRACVNCVKAKAKCAESLHAGAICERCQRMSKDCQPSPPARRRKPLKGASKTALLEEKLEGLVELLKARTNPSEVRLVNQEPSSESNVDINEAATSTLPISSGYSSNGGILSHQESVHVFDHVPIPKTVPKASSPWTIDPSSTNSRPIVRELSPQEAQECLETFRSQFLPILPILYIPPTTTVEELRESHPFLWQSILIVCVKSSRYQHAVAEEFRIMIGRETFVEGRKNLDLLQAILVFSSWDQRHLFYKHIMGNLMHVSIAIVNDLSLNRPPPKPSQLILLEYNDRGCPRLPRSTIRTLDERRALIGCFLLSSLGASFFQKGDSMRWTPYLEECCKVLEEKRETLDDITLIQLARSHLVVDKIFQSPWHDYVGDAQAPPKPPAELYVKSLESQLQEFKRNIPLDLQQSEIMLLEIYSIEVSIYEVALSKAPNLFNDQSFQRLEYLYACLRSLKSWFNVFFSLPAAKLFRFPISIYCQMAHCTICLYRISTFEFQNWDTAFVRGNVNFLSTVQQIMERLKEVKAAIGLDIGVVEGIYSFSFLAEKLPYIKNWWEKVATNFIVPSMDAPLNAGDDVSMEFLDDTWFPELLAPWDPANLHYTDFSNSAV